MTNTELPENSPNMTSENELNASLGYVAVFHPSEVSLQTDETNKTLLVRIPVSPDQAEKYLKGGEIHASVGYKIDPDLSGQKRQFVQAKRIIKS